MKKIVIVLVVMVWALGCSEDPRTEQCQEADSLEGQSCDDASDCDNAYYCVCGDEDVLVMSSACVNGSCAGADEACEEGFLFFPGACEGSGGWNGDCYAAED